MTFITDIVSTNVHTTRISTIKGMAMLSARVEGAKIYGCHLNYEMNRVKMTTHWTPEEADTIYRFLEYFKDALWQSYGEEIVQMHTTIQDEQQGWDEEEMTLDDEIPF